MTFINASILTLLLVLILAVLVKKGKKLTDYFLLVTISSFAGYVASDIWIKNSLNHNSFAFHYISSYFFVIPTLFYGLLVISKSHRLKKSWWGFTLLHISFFLYVIGDIYIWNNYTISDIQKFYISPEWPYRVFNKSIQIYSIIVMIWFLRKLNAYQANIQNFYSNLERVDFGWLKYLAWTIIAAYSTTLVVWFFYHLSLINNVRIPYLLISISLLLSFIWMIYNGLKQYTLANFSEPAHASEEVRKYATSSLSSSDAALLFQKIELLFENETIYQNQDLKVQDIAKRLMVTNHNISQSLNEIAGKTFYEYVNDYRLQYFQNQLANPQKKQFTILALGMESGFSSKATINRVFKNRIGETPKEYQQRMLA